MLKCIEMYYYTPRRRGGGGERERGRGAYGRLAHVNVINGDDYRTASVPVPDRIAGSRSRPKGQAGGGG